MFQRFEPHGYPAMVRLHIPLPLLPVRRQWSYVKLDLNWAVHSCTVLLFDIKLARFMKFMTPLHWYIKELWTWEGKPGNPGQTWLAPWCSVLHEELTMAHLYSWVLTWFHGSTVLHYFANWNMNISQHFLFPTIVGASFAFSNLFQFRSQTAHLLAPS